MPALTTPTHARIVESAAVVTSSIWSATLVTKSTASNTAPEIEPTRSTVLFRHLPADRGPEGATAAELDGHNARLAAAIQRDGSVFLAPAELDGRTCLRVCFVNFRTRDRDLDLVFEAVSRLGASA